MHAKSTPGDDTESRRAVAGPPRAAEGRRRALPPGNHPGPNVARDKFSESGGGSQGSMTKDLLLAVPG
jgi:hypothetical protein